MRTLLVAVLALSSVYAEDTTALGRKPELPPATTQTVAGRTMWLASIGALTGANVMDVQSSWGKIELNQNLAGSAGTFGRKGALMKLGIMGGVCTLEYLVLRHRPSTKLYRSLAAINYGGASVTGAVAIRNYGIPGR